MKVLAITILLVIAGGLVMPQAPVLGLVMWFGAYHAGRMIDAESEGRFIGWLFVLGVLGALVTALFGIVRNL